MPLLVMLRHGQSSWNLENRFTGWTDVDLSPAGIAEAERAGAVLREAGLSFDVAFTSVLKRAIRTLWIVLDELDRMWIPQHATWRLNERHYGALQGLDKADTARRLGEEEVHRVRRGFRARPPLLAPDDPRHPAHDPRYAGLAPAELTGGESLADTLERLLPCWEGEIAPRLRTEARILVAAHGNSLRAMVMQLEGLGPEQVEALEIPTGVPLVYTLEPDLAVRERHYLATPGPPAGS